jgi:hypothetical protein
MCLFKGKVLQWLGIPFLNIVFLGLLHAHLPDIHLLIALAFATPHAYSCEVTCLSLSQSCEGGQIFIADLHCCSWPVAVALGQTDGSSLLRTLISTIVS